MKWLNNSTISIGWMALLLIMAIAHLQGKPLVPYQSAMIFWLVMTVLNLGIQKRRQMEPATRTVPSEKSDC